MKCLHPLGMSCGSCKLDARVYTTTSSDGLPVIVIDVKETKEQIEQRVRSEEFEFYMKLLKANNGVGAMTEAMWLLFENDYYERGASKDIAKWKHYLRRLKKEETSE